MSSWFQVSAGITSTHFPASWTVHFFQRSVGTSQNRSLPGQSTGSQRSYCKAAVPCRENTHNWYEPTNRMVWPPSWLTHPKTGAVSLEVFFDRKWSDFLLRQCLQEVATQIEKVHFVLSPADDGGEIVVAARVGINVCLHVDAALAGVVNQGDDLVHMAPVFLVRDLDVDHVHRHAGICTSNRSTCRRSARGCGKRHLRPGGRRRT